MTRLFVVALTGSLFSLPCSNRTGSDSPPAQCALDSASLAQTARSGLEKFGIASPNAETSIEVVQRPIHLRDAERLIITASWGGPSDGAILWADCHGTILDGEASGYVLALDPLVQPERVLVELRAITGTGSGWKQESIHLYAARPADLVRVWSGVVAERSYQGATIGAYEEEGELTHIDADSLVYSSTRFPVTMAPDGSWRRDQQRAERTVETYLWNPEAQQYERRSAR